MLILLMVEAVFTEEDKKNLKTVVEEMPKSHLEVELLRVMLKILRRYLQKNLIFSIKNRTKKGFCGVIAILRTFKPCPRHHSILLQ
jgi:hypothetical protein